MTWARGLDFSASVSSFIIPVYRVTVSLMSIHCQVPGMSSINDFDGLEGKIKLSLHHGSLLSFFPIPKEPGRGWSGRYYKIKSMPIRLCNNLLSLI